MKKQLREFSKQKNVLITLDSCVASTNTYDVLHQITRLYDIAKKQDILSYRRKIILVMPEQILRESAHVHDQPLLDNILAAPRGSNLHSISYPIRRTPFATYYSKHQDSHAARVEIFRTGYCDGFSTRLAEDVLPAIASEYLWVERLFSRKERQRLLSSSATNQASDLNINMGCEILKQSNTNDKKDEQNIRLIGSILGVYYSIIENLMSSTRDKKYDKFVNDPKILKSSMLRSPSVIQTLKMMGVWIGRHEGKMQSAHRDCGDFAILQMYTKFLTSLFRNHGSWIFAPVSSDVELLTNISEINLSSPRTEKISHPEYHSLSRQYSLKTKYPEKLPVTPMRLSEFYLFALGCIESVTNIDFDYSITDKNRLHIDSVRKIRKWIFENQHKHKNSFITCLEKLCRGLDNLHSEAASKNQSEINPRKNPYLAANIDFTLDYLALGFLPDLNDYKVSPKSLRYKGR